MSWGTPLVAISPRRNKYGTHALLRDIDDVLVVGRKVYREGIAEGHMWIADVNREHKLVAVRRPGYTSYGGRMSGSVYSAAVDMVFVYREVPYGNRIEVVVDFPAEIEIPVKSPPREATE